MATPYCLAAFSLFLASAAFAADADVNKLGAPDGTRIAGEVADMFGKNFCYGASNVPNRDGGFPGNPRFEVSSFCGRLCTDRLADRLADMDKGTPAQSGTYVETCATTCKGLAVNLSWVKAKELIKSVPCREAVASYYGYTAGIKRAAQWSDETVGKRASRSEIKNMAKVYCELGIFNALTSTLEGHLTENEVAEFLTQSFSDSCADNYTTHFVKELNALSGNSLKKSRQENLSEGRDSKQLRGPRPPMAH